MANKEKNFVSAVIYVHNAEDRIESFLKMVIKAMEDNFDHSEIICVNDHSDDNSLNIIKKASSSASLTSISVVNLSYFHGLEMAMNAGVDMSIGDFVFEFDNTYADFEPALIMDIYRHSLKGFDIVSASPDRKERFSSNLFYRIFDRFNDISCKMTTESFRILSRRVINRISSMNKTVPYRKAIYANCGLKTDNIKYPVSGKSPKTDTAENKYRKKLAADTLILFTNVGYKFSICMTVFMMLVSVFMLIYCIGTYIAANPVEGWTTMVLFMSVAFLGLFGILTVIIKYLQIIIDLVFKRKHYSFESIEKLTK